MTNVPSEVLDQIKRDVEKAKAYCDNVSRHPPGCEGGPWDCVGCEAAGLLDEVITALDAAVQKPKAGKMRSATEWAHQIHPVNSDYHLASFDEVVRLVNDVQQDALSATQPTETGN